jgi:hypothetical protein
LSGSVASDSYPLSDLALIGSGRSGQLGLRAVLRCEGRYASLCQAERDTSELGEQVGPIASDLTKLGHGLLQIVDLAAASMAPRYGGDPRAQDLISGAHTWILERVTTRRAWPGGELLFEADALSAGPVGAKPDAEQLIERIICRPVWVYHIFPGKFITQALGPEQPVVDVILGRGQRPPPVTPLPLVAVERGRLRRGCGPVKRKQDIDSQPPGHPLDPSEITWVKKRLVLTSPQQSRLFYCQPEHLRRWLEN